MTQFATRPQPQRGEIPANQRRSLARAAVGLPVQAAPSSQDLVAEPRHQLLRPNSQPRAPLYVIPFEAGCAPLVAIESTPYYPHVKRHPWPLKHTYFGWSYLQAWASRDKTPSRRQRRDGGRSPPPRGVVSQHPAAVSSWRAAEAGCRSCRGLVAGLGEGLDIIIIRGTDRSVRRAWCILVALFAGTPARQPRVP